MYNVRKELNKYLNKKVHHRTLNSKWYGFDSEENFKNNLKTNFDKLEYYLSNTIYYNWNTDKFRADFEFIPNKKIDVDIYLGCSHTSGIGHLWENTWPYHVSKFTGNKIVNLGVGGKGIEISFINLSKYINYFNVKNVFHFQPIYGRYSYPYKGVIGNVLIQNVNVNTQDEDYIPWRKKYIKEELLNKDYIVYNHYKNIMCLEGLCKNYGIPYFHSFEIPKIEVKQETLPARDLIHFNSTQLATIAKLFIKQLKTNPSGCNEFLSKLKIETLTIL